MQRDTDQPSIEVLLEGNTFTERDAEKVAARLGPEFDAHVGRVAYSPLPGGPPPDVALELLASTLPLASIYVNLLSSAIYDLLKAFATNTGKPETEAMLTITVMVDDGNEVRNFTGKTTDPEIAERWLQTLNDEARED